MRDRSRAAAQALLAAESGSLTELELLKLHTGLWYDMFMCDGVLAQQRLANELAQMAIDNQTDANAIVYLYSMWQVMGREWGVLDKYRIDKFFLLQRRYLAAGFQILARSRWNTDIISQHSTMLDSFLQSPKFPLGIKIHILDIFIPELVNVLTSAAPENSPSANIIDIVLDPIQKLSRNASKPLKSRAIDALASTELLPWVGGGNNANSLADQNTRPGSDSDEFTGFEE